MDHRPWPTHTRTPMHTHTHAHACAHAHKRTRTRTRARTPTRTRTRTQGVARVRPRTWEDAPHVLALVGGVGLHLLAQFDGALESYRSEPFERVALLQASSGEANVP